MFPSRQNKSFSVQAFKVDKIFWFSTAMTVTTWDMYDTLCGAEQDETGLGLEREKADYPEAVVDTSRSAEMSVSVGSTVSSGSNQRSRRGCSAAVIQNVQYYHLLFLFSQCFQLTERRGYVWEPFKC